VKLILLHKNLQVITVILLSPDYLMLIKNQKCR